VAWWLQESAVIYFVYGSPHIVYSKLNFQICLVAVGR